MRTHTGKKRPDGRGGYKATVTVQGGGPRLEVHVRRGRFRRNWFGHDQYHWTADVSCSAWRVEGMVITPDLSVRRIAIAAMTRQGVQR